MSTDPAAGRLIVLRHPDLRRYLTARFIASIATQVQTVAVGWQVFRATGDPFDLGLVALSQFLPFVLLILPAGHVADRYDRRRIQLVTYVLLAACAAALFGLALSGNIDTGPVFAVMVLFGTARAFNHPVGQALLPNLAPIALFPRAVAVNSSLGQVATIAGPAIGGALVLFGEQVAFGLSLVLLGAAVVLVAGLRGGGRTEASTEPVSWAALLTGVNFVRSRPIVLGSISLDLFAVLFGGAVALLPIFAKDILEVGPTGLGLLRTAPAIGSFAAALLIARFSIRRRAGPTLFVVVAGFGVCMIVFGLSREMWLSMLALTLAGAFDLVSVVLRSTILPLVTPDELRGRVNAVEMVFISASNELGAFESGVAAALIGAVPAVVVGGVATVVVAVVWWRLFPSLARVDRLDELRPVALESG